MSPFKKKMKEKSHPEIIKIFLSRFENIFIFIFSLFLTSHVETILQSKTKEVCKSPLTYSKYL
jgi:hypothetical protein